MLLLNFAIFLSLKLRKSKNVSFFHPSLCQILTLKENLCKNYPKIKQLKAYHYLKHLVSPRTDIFKSKIFIVRKKILALYLTLHNTDNSNYRQIYEITNISGLIGWIKGLYKKILLNLIELISTLLDWLSKCWNQEE